MAFFKRGEAFEIKASDIQSVESVIPMIDDSVVAEMKNYVEGIKTASVNGKLIAPKANDFLYFAAVMLHAAEAALINDDGSPRLTRDGKVVEGGFDTSKGTWKWICNDPSVKALKNANGDIFPEQELIKAYKKWIGKPLCIDHKSSSVDHTRGFIVDTYYDRKLKRVVGLCALDRKNYPDLARKVETGYSNSVSMGTAVTQAVCYDCGNIARNEHDFCNHMRTKSGYGEINIGLNPMELSIVVNGADGKAKIKHVLAAANALNSYIEEKSAQLEAFAAKTEQYEGTVKFTTNEIDEKAEKDGFGNPQLIPNSNEESTLVFHANNIEDFRKALNEAIDNFKNLQNSGNNEELNHADNQSSGKQAMQEGDLPATEYNDAPPHARFASSDDIDLEKELSEIKMSIEAKLNKMQEDLNKLAGLTNKEEIMSGTNKKEAYFLGGGDVNEPTPGQRKYPVDPLQDNLRDKEDRQMVGQKPFPEVGDVDSLYPGNNSTPGSSELEQKKMLLRAQEETRAQRRSEAVSKVKEALKTQAYFGGTTEPVAPGKTQYKPDPMEVNLRNKEDKQMVGQKPFPEVGDVDGLHPSPDSVDMKDEKKRKEMLSRASELRGRFVKAETQGQSAWEFTQGDEVVLRKTVDELTSGNSETLYNVVATKAFGQDLHSKIKAFGAKTVDKLYKAAQDVQALPPAAPASVEAPADLPKEEDTNNDGDPKQTVLDLSTKVKDLSSDLNEAVNNLLGESAEMGAEMPMAAADGTLSSTARLQASAPALAQELAQEIQSNVEMLNDSAKSLDTLASCYDKGLDMSSELTSGIVEDTVSDTNAVVAQSMRLLSSYIKFGRATKTLAKRARQEQANKLIANGEDMLENKEIMDMLGQTDAELDDLGTELEDEKEVHEDELLHDLLSDDLDALNGPDTVRDEEPHFHDKNHAVMTSSPEKAVELAKKDPSVNVELKSASTKAERQALRTKFAADVKWSPMLAEFHKHVEDPSFDIKPSDNLGHVETPEEVNEAMMDLATSGPNVRKLASEIDKMVKAGELAVGDLDLLVANGIDPAAVKYWKEFYGEAGSEGKTFAAELVKGHAKASVEEEMNLYRVKIARAYELANDMVSRGLCPNNRNAISAQVDEIMKWNDAGFESMKKTVASHAPQKVATAGRIPQVGIFNDNSSVEQKSEYDLFVQAMSSGRKPRMF